MSYKPDFRALTPSRRCYEEIDGNLSLFWVNADNSRTPILPFGATVTTLRQIGYRLPEEREETKSDKKDEE